jgi:hypothetical protein
VNSGSDKNDPKARRQRKDSFILSKDSIADTPVKPAAGNISIDRIGPRLALIAAIIALLVKCIELCVVIRIYAVFLVPGMLLASFLIYLVIAWAISISLSHKRILGRCRLCWAALIATIILVILLFLLGLLIDSLGPSVRITSPKTGERVSHLVTAEGTVLDRTTQVWIIVHPIQTGSYFVAPAVSVRSDRTWSGLAYIGSTGASSGGRSFEIGVVANPRRVLKVGQVLDRWPEADSLDVVEVVKKY